MTSEPEKYGLTEELLLCMIEHQKACEICGEEFNEGRTSSPHVDHSHATGRTRALLCRACNLGIGVFYDSPELLRVAADALGKDGAERCFPGIRFFNRNAAILRGAADYCEWHNKIDRLAFSHLFESAPEIAA